MVGSERILQVPELGGVINYVQNEKFKRRVKGVKTWKKKFKKVLIFLEKFQKSLIKFCKSFDQFKHFQFLPQTFPKLSSPHKTLPTMHFIISLLVLSPRLHALNHL